MSLRSIFCIILISLLSTLCSLTAKITSHFSPSSSILVIYLLCLLYSISYILLCSTTSCNVC
uniref:Uncharacterized protein n=1 Tax=Podoviridae sp. ctZkC8 TaxID=2825259 RepID=A0A8S5UBU7_9CAUD|nr:MAG TPA: hypothetical protein [Podoviridae sp. ctZkC8]